MLHYKFMLRLTIYFLFFCNLTHASKNTPEVFSPETREIILIHVNQWIEENMVGGDPIDDSAFRTLFLDLRNEGFFDRDSVFETSMFTLRHCFKRNLTLSINRGFYKFDVIFKASRTRERALVIKKILSTPVISQLQPDEDLQRIVERHINRWLQKEKYPDTKGNDEGYRELFRDLKNANLIFQNINHSSKIFGRSLYFRKRPSLILNLSPGCCYFRFRRVTGHPFEVELASIEPLLRNHSPETIYHGQAEK